MRKRLGFVLFDQFEDLDFMGPWEMLGLWSRDHNGPELYIVSENGSGCVSTKGLIIQTDVDFKSCPKLDYCLIPGGQGTRTEVNNEALVGFIREQGDYCDQILSVCTGAFLLQAAGLLKDKKATTHWASMDRLRAFDDVEVLEQRYVQDGNIWTSAGVSAGIDLSLAFIAAIADENTAGDIQLFAEFFPKGKVYPNSPGINIFYND